MSVESCRTSVADDLSLHAAELPADARRSLVDRISYLRADVRDVDALRSMPVTTSMLVYFATPPEVVPAALRALCNAGILNAPARLIFDKPFGTSHASAQVLNTQIRELTEERNVYRIDHFLYHHAVQELVGWRVGSDGLSLVDLLPVTQMEIVWDETRAAPAAGSSYCGVIRDMIQSHLLQLAAVTTMESPESMTRADLASSRLDALRQLSARVDDSDPPSAPADNPETVATVALRSQMSRWERVPLLLRAAKGVDRSHRHIELRFAQNSSEAPLGFVRLEVLAGILAVGVVDRQASPVEFRISAEPESASTRLLRAALLGDDTFTLLPEEPEEAWRIVEPVLNGWGESGAESSSA